MSGLDLCAPFGDVLRPPGPTTLAQLTDASIFIYRCDAGSMSSLYDNVRNWQGDHLYEGVVVGASSEFEEPDAEFKSACEAAERYSSSVLLDGEYRVATHEELGGDAFDWRTLPRLSEEELADPHQMFSPFSPSDPIRWIRGLHVSSGKQKWLPIAMTHLFPRVWSTERFAVPISTGTAVHTDELVGIASAINEVVERDATALTWLLRRPIQRIRIRSEHLSTFPQPLAELLSSEEFHLYDATTDVGVPTVYARRFRAGNEKASNIVACASAFEYERAIEKALTEVVMLSRTFEQGSFVPKEDMLDCEAVHDGAVFVSRAEYAHAFAFLDGNGDVDLAELSRRQPVRATAAPAEKLRWLLRRLSDLRMDVYLVNLTCDELADVGLQCWRAVVPQLMPMSLIRRSRFLATPRLAQIAEKEGLARSLTADINPYPQPFA